MHELPIVTSLSKQVISAAKQNKMISVKSVTITLGEFSGFVDDSIEFYWDIVSKDTIAEKSRVSIKRVVSDKLELTSIEGDYEEDKKSID